MSKQKSRITNWKEQRRLHALKLNKQNWKIVSFSSEETSGEGTLNGRATTLIDGNASTYWHSKWTGTAATYPHEVIIDLGASLSPNGMALTQRNGLSRAIKDIMFGLDQMELLFPPRKHLFWPI